MNDTAARAFKAQAFFALALPMIVSRAGLATMGIADGLMVARYSAHEFAWLALAEGTLGRLLDVCIALLIGGLMLVPRHMARHDAHGARLIWKRTLPVAFALGVLCLLVSFAGPRLLLFAGEAPALAAGAGAVMRILGLGYPAALLAISAAVYLEGTRHPVFVAACVVATNVLNIAFNWALIGGHYGLPALGARGSAWSTTAVRYALAVLLVGYALYTRDLSPDTPTEEHLAERRLARRTQWRLGMGGAITAAGMVSLTAPLLLFAGWLGLLPLAAFSATWNLAAPLGLITLGLADAAGIQIAAMAGSRGDRPATKLAWAALRTALVPVAALALLWFVLARPIAALYTTDALLRAAIPPLVPVLACILLVDCTGFMVASSLRSLREAAWPASIEIGSMVLLLPLAFALAFHTGLGVRGLLLATLAAGTLRTTLLILRLRLRDWHIPTPDLNIVTESRPIRAD